MATITKPRVVRGTVASERKRLETFIGRMEHRYECASPDMEAAVASGAMRETAEVGRWLIALRFLRDLNDLGRTTGTHMSNTK